MKYYVSNAGSDTNNGRSPGAAWASIAKVNAATFNPGDMVLFRRNDEFFGKLTIPGVRSVQDKKVTVGAYGSGRLPKLSRYKVLTSTSWVAHAANIWKIDLSDLTKFTGDREVGLQGVNVGFLRVAGAIKGVKRWSVDTLAADWEFYSDEAQWLYVYSATNPGQRATDIRAAIGQRIVDYVGGGNGIRYINLDLVGCGGHAINGSLKDVEVKGCWIHELGGGRLDGFATPNTRYGNGVEFWNGSARSDVVGNFIWDVYDVGVTMQGNECTPATGWSDIWFRQNVFWGCNQNFEIWATGVGGGVGAAGSGYHRTGFVDNVCLQAGNAWSSSVRPDQSTKCHLLLYTISVPDVDVRVKGNAFYSSTGQLISRPSMVNALPAGYNLDDNNIFLRPGQAIFSGSAYTAEQMDAFGAAFGTGRNCAVELLRDADAVNLEDAVAKLLNSSSAGSAAANVHESALSELHGMVAAAYGEVDQVLAASLFPGFETRATTVSADGFAKLLTVRITSVGSRFDGGFHYMIGGDSTANRNGFGAVSMQVVPSNNFAAGSTYVDLDVCEFLPLRTGVTYADFRAVVVAETPGVEAIVELYFNIGKDNYSRLKTQPICVLVSEQTTVEYTFHQATALVADLPAGATTIGKIEDTPYMPKPVVTNVNPSGAPLYSGQIWINYTTNVTWVATYATNETGWRPISSPRTGNAAPNFAPGYVGQDYMDLTNKKAYKAFGTSASTDWVILN
jgi:hypothetical protein